MPVKVISGVWDDISGLPTRGTDDVVARGIRYAADNGAHVINMSIGRSGPANCTDQFGCGRLRAGNRGGHQICSEQGFLRGGRRGKRF
jgi:subtilisin family serine protease